MSIRPVLWLATALLLLAPARAQDFEQDCKAQRASLVERLLGLATWCHGKELFLERDQTWRQVLRLDTDNPEARKGLRYAHNSDGSWKEPAPRSVQNLNKKALEELPARRAEVLRPYRDAVLELIVKDQPPPEKVRAVHDEILAMDPDDARVHGLRGEIKDQGQWVLSETARGRQRRVEIRTLVKDALEAKLEFSPATAAANEAGWVDDWSCGTRTAFVRVLGAGGTADCEALARLLHGTTLAFGKLLAIEAKYPSDFDFFALHGVADRNAFLERFPALDAGRKQLFTIAPGGGLPGGHATVLFDSDARRRNDCAVRNALSQLLRANFAIEMDHGWAFEGVGLYLTRELCGSRLTWFVLGNPSTEALRAGLLAPDSNWMNEGLTLLTKSGAAPIESALSKPVAQLDLTEMVLCYVFSAYLFEGRPEQVAEFLQRTGAGTPWTEVTRAVLGMTPRELQERLITWLKERK